MIDAALNLAVSRSFELMLVQFLQSIQQHPTALAADTLGIAEIQDGISGRSKQDALMPRRQEPAAPQVSSQRLAAFVLCDQHNKRRQIGVVLSQAVAQPRSHARTSGDLSPRLQKRDARPVIDRLRVHRIDDAQVVRDAGSVRQQFAEPRTGLAVLSELERRTDERNGRLIARHARESLVPRTESGSCSPFILLSSGL